MTNNNSYKYAFIHPYYINTLHYLINKSNCTTTSTYTIQTNNISMVF